MEQRSENISSLALCQLPASRGTGFFSNGSCDEGQAKPSLPSKSADNFVPGTSTIGTRLVLGGLGARKARILQGGNGYLNPNPA